MKKIFIILLIMSVGACQLFARLGETSEQCQKRYGNPVREIKNVDGYSHKYYFKGKFVVVAVFKDDKVAGIIYSKPDPSSLFFQQSMKKNELIDVVDFQKFVNLKLTGLEIDCFLDANEAGGTWTSILEGSVWRRNDGAEAAYDEVNRTLAINSKEYLEYLGKQKESDLSGF